MPGGPLLAPFRNVRVFCSLKVVASYGSLTYINHLPRSSYADYFAAPQWKSPTFLLVWAKWAHLVVKGTWGESIQVKLLVVLCTHGRRQKRANYSSGGTFKSLVQ